MSSLAAQVAELKRDFEDAKFSPVRVPDDDDDLGFTRRYSPLSDAIGTTARGIARDRAIAKIYGDGPLHLPGWTVEIQKAVYAETNRLTPLVCQEVIETGLANAEVMSRYEHNLTWVNESTRNRPSFLRIWPEWRPNMSPEERIKFEILFINEMDVRDPRQPKDAA